MLNLIKRKQVKDRKAIRKDEIEFPVQDRVELSVYWKDVAAGKGAAIALYALGCEIIRFDCFGSPGGHFHVYRGDFRDKTGPRFLFPEQSVDEQFQRAEFELRHNSQTYLDTHPARNIRGIRLDPEKLNGAVDEAVAKLSGLSQKANAEGGPTDGS